MVLLGVVLANKIVKAAEAQGSHPEDSKTAVHRHSGSSRGLRLKRMDACMQVQKSQPYQSGSEDRSKRDRGDVPHCGYKRSRSGGAHCQRI
jgi:hypothetical protein